MNKEEIIKKLLKQIIYTNGDNKKCIDFCNNCDKIVTQTEINGSFCCEYCHSENISQIEITK